MNLDIVVILLAGAVTWMLRASFITFAGDRALPAGAYRLLAHARPAVCAALLASIVSTRAEPEAAVMVPLAVGLAGAATAALKTSNMAWSVAGGLAAFIVAGWLVSVAPVVVAGVAS